MRECLASGKPTVSVDVPEVRILEPHVRVAEDRDAFLRHVAQALAEPPDPALAAARQRSVAQDGWDRRAQALRTYLDELISDGPGTPGGRPAAASLRGNP